MSTLFGAVVIVLLVLSAYLILYTAYDKVRKTLVFSQLLDLFLCRRGLDWTLVEINKAISLAGLTVLLIAFLPYLEQWCYDLIFCAMNLLYAHGVYSVYKFYSFSLQRFFADKLIKKISIALAILGQISLAGGYLGFFSYGFLLNGSLIFGIAHFWTMEVDYKYVLQVRPFAYLPFLLAPVVLLLQFMRS